MIFHFFYMLCTIYYYDAVSIFFMHAVSIIETISILVNAWH